MKRIKEVENRLKDARKGSKQEMRRKQKEKAERKKINEFKSSTYQTVSNYSIFDTEFFVLDRKSVKDAHVVEKS